ncbi:MAG TPA: cytochrome c [Candidatus Acidoferrales bacterium]|jgi:mono/diheme cytochrome c family protein|nr:cytochrome c [Candidatus Acidoferrales bacterium]
MTRRLTILLLLLTMSVALVAAARDQNAAKKRASRLGSAPASAEARSNPYEGNHDAVRAGQKLYGRYCAECHGKDLAGQRKTPALDSQNVEQAAPGKLFWVLTNGDLRKGMPAWSELPEQQRWQIVSYLKSARNK